MAKEIRTRFWKIFQIENEQKKILFRIKKPQSRNYNLEEKMYPVQELRM